MKCMLCSQSRNAKTFPLAVTTLRLTRRLITLLMDTADVETCRTRNFLELGLGAGVATPDISLLDATVAPEISNP